MKLIALLLAFAPALAMGQTTHTLKPQSAPIRISDRDESVKRDLRTWSKLDGKVMGMERVRAELRKVRGEIIATQAEIDSLRNGSSALDAQAAAQAQYAQWLAQQPIQTRTDQVAAGAQGWRSNTYQGRPGVIYQDGAGASMERTQANNQTIDPRPQAQVAMQKAQMSADQSKENKAALAAAQSALAPLKKREAEIMAFLRAESERTSNGMQPTTATVPLSP